MRTLFIIGTLIVTLALLVPVAPLAAAPTTDSALLILAPSTGHSGLEPQARLTPILASWRADKLITSYEWLPDANAMQLNGVDSTAADMLYTLPGVVRVTAVRADILAAARQQQQLQTRDTYRTTESALNSAARTADTPHFNIHETWDLLQGNDLSPNQAVTAVLKDSGANVKATLNVNADGAGNLKESFNADVVQGDYVEITYNATLVTIHSDAITIDFDYVNNHITGTAGQDRTVVVNTRDDGIGWCQHHEYSMPTTTNGAGAYDANLDGNYDVVARTEVDLTSLDENDNGWTVWRHAPWLHLRTQPNAGNGDGTALAPDEDLTLTLKNGSNVKDSFTLHSNSPDAGFGFGFKQADPLPGDTLEITENSNTWATVSIVNLTAKLNPATGIVTGKAPAGQQVFVGARHYDRASGDWTSPPCQVVTADGSGNYSATFSGPFIGGDTASVFYADAAGFEQEVWDQVPYLTLRKGENILEGSFHSSYDGELDITVASKTNQIKYQGKGVAYGGWFSQMLAKSGAPVKLAAQDVVTVIPKPASGTLTATVAKLNINLNLGTNSVSGTALKNTHLQVIAQKWWGNGFECRNDCWQNIQTNGTGNFTHTFNNDLVSGDYASVQLVDAKGNNTVQTAYSTSPTITLDSYPATFRRGRPNEVKYTVANGLHVDDTNISGDSQSRPDWKYTLQNGPDGNWWPGGPGQYKVNVYIPFQGKFFFRAFARVDGRWIFTTPETVAKAR